MLSEKVFSYNGRNQVTSVENVGDPNATVSYGYDENGNQVSRVSAAGATTFTFDVKNRLVEAGADGSTLGSYRYNFMGLRVQKTTADSGEERYVYDQQSVLLRRGEAGAVTKYEYGPTRLLSVNDSGDGRAYYLFDALGSVTDMTTAAGIVLGRYQWDAWGNKRSSIETDANPFGFTGHEHDDETGLVYAKARFYDPELGLFLSEDPVMGGVGEPPSLHRYLYAFQNPTVYVDPDGRRPVFSNVASPDEITDNVDSIEELQRMILVLNERVRNFSSRAKSEEAMTRELKVRRLITTLEGALESKLAMLERDLDFLGEITYVVEGIEGNEARKVVLFEYLRDKKGLGSEIASTLAGEWLGSLACEDQTCDKVGSIGSNASAMKVMEAAVIAAVSFLFEELVLGELVIAEAPTIWGADVARMRLIEVLKLRERQLVLGVDPAKGFDKAEGIGGVRLEQALGRQLERSSDSAYDFIDRGRFGRIDIKGPLLKAELTTMEEFAESIIKEANRSTASQTVAVDLKGLSEFQKAAVKRLVKDGVTTSKPILYIE